MKRILTMQDLSGIGTCSLSVALPVLSVMGYKTVALADAVFSSHTGFPHPVVQDLTAFCAETAERWEKEKVQFDAVYTGYMARVEQIAVAQRLCVETGSNAVVLIDPCMADSGRLYHGLGEEYPAHMRELCALGNILTPNRTELEMLTGISGDMKAAVLSLVGKNTRVVIVTGIDDEAGDIGILGYDVMHAYWFSYKTKKIPQSFSGTGDLWASVFLGFLLRDKKPEAAARYACDFVRRVLCRSDAQDIYGICFEPELHVLCDMH